MIMKFSLICTKRFDRLITQSHRWNCVHREKPLSCLNGTWEGYLIFQPQTKAPNPTTSEQEQDDALIQESRAQLGAQAWSSLSWPDENTAPALWLFSSPTSAGTAPSCFLTVYSSHRFLSTVIWGVQVLPTQEWSLTVHLRCERTLPGRAPGMMREQVTAGWAQRGLTAPLQLLGHMLGSGHLQSKWQLLPHIYPSGSNCGATSIASDSHPSLSQSNPSWP